MAFRVPRPWGFCHGSGSSKDRDNSLGPRVRTSLPLQGSGKTSHLPKVGRQRVPVAPWQCPEEG